MITGFEICIRLYARHKIFLYLHSTYIINNSNYCQRKNDISLIYENLIIYVSSSINYLQISGDYNSILPNQNTENLVC